METIEKILEKIKEIRKERGFSHENMAHELGISQAAYTNLEKNESKLTVERLISISDILKKPAYEFFDGTLQNIYNQQNTDNVIGHQENNYKDDKDTITMLMTSFQERIKAQQEEIDFLRKKFNP